ncbi:glutamine--fructose-6-phosphate aminotransferase [Nitrosarchaeum sp.]|nr:glutamine--fructose-6-phosphate aminotransferase [Nitrosarchaeum sp.]
MCSIIGCITNSNASGSLVNGLKRMEYRGYDSVGVATNSNSKILLKKGVGKVNIVNSNLKLDTMPGHVGIGHTRWATHGKVNEVNAHPHLCSDDSIAVVHNGIIENYCELRKELEKEGVIFKSETDTEVIPNLLGSYFKKTGSIKEMIIKTVSKLKGQYSFISLLEDGSLVAARFHEPLIVGLGEKECFVSSDVLGFIEKTDQVIYLQNEQFVIIDNKGYKIYNFDGKQAPYEIVTVSQQSNDVNKNGYRHFTRKEIFEQPYTMLNTINNLNNDWQTFAEIVKNSPNVYITGSGTSYNVALMARYLFPMYTKISPEAIMSSEMTYSKNRLRKNSLLIAISQSGESADVLEAVSIAKEKGLKVISVVNSLTSSLERESDVSLGLYCGTEIGVAATKSFISQLSIIYKIIGLISKKHLAFNFKTVSKLMAEILDNEPMIINIAKELKNASDIYILGRGIHYPIAKEGALKIKELSYIHAEGFPTGELKHGPLALMSESSYVIAINPQDNTYQNNLSNIQEVKARGAKIIGISDKNHEVYDRWIKIPNIEPDILYPMLEIIPFQLLAYHTSLERGEDPDYPRNLAKCVTVK